MIGNGDTCMLENLKLSLDEACLEISNMRNETLTIFGQYTECRRCKFKLLAVLQPGNYTSVSLNTRYPAEFYFTNETESEKHYCRFEKTTLEHYIYGWNILNDECGEVFVKRDAPNYLIPILFALIALLSLGILWYTLKYVHEILKSTYAEFLKMMMKSKSEPPTELDDFSGDFARNQKLPDKIIRLNNRIKSIDVFRGLCMMLMIFVFSGGGYYWFFNHVIWNGFTIADLIFPWFQWLMGVSFSISLQKKLQLRIPKRIIILQVIKRSLIFVCMGIIINSNRSFTTLSQLRWCGVLQRFGLCYLIVGLLEVPFAKKTKTEQTSFSPLGDIQNYRYQFLGVLAMLFVHTYFTFFFDVPDGCGRGYLGPGGLDEGGKYENCTGGAAGYIDRLILGNRHLFKSQIRLYENKQNYDHEGLLGTLTSVFLVYMGVQCGHIFNMYQEPKEKVKRMLIWGSVTAGVFQWLFIILGLSIWLTYTSAKEIRVVCYYTNWSVYRPGTAKFSPQNINPYLCTHLIYAFGGFTKENNLKPFDKYQDIEKGGYAKFTGLKTYNKDLKTMLAIGGWNEASSRFSPMVANADRRKQLVKNSIKFLRQNHFDGLDLDWEYPAFREGGKAADKENYAKLVQELREEFDRESEKTGRPRLLLTMAVPAGIEYVNKGYDIPKLTKYLDWMNILSYDYHSAFEPSVNHHAPLFPLQEATEYDYDADLNIDYTINHYLELGADPNKLVMGIPTYGRSYTLFNPDANALGDPADGPGEMGEATRENGYLAYYEICENVKSNDWTVVQPNEKAMGPFAFKGNQWVGYDDENIARKKSEYVAKNNLGGIMFWAIDNDDFRGNCHGKPYPLIEAAKEALINAYGLTDDNLISPTSKPVRSKNQPRKRPGKATTEKVKVSEESSTSSSTSRRKNRLKPKQNVRKSSSPDRSDNKDKIAEETLTYSSLKVITPAYTTPEPPATPDQGGAFKCEDEGFFPHPKDCKKYFWCLNGPGELGIVAHSFTCPAGLFFNKAADSCDYSQNVLCNKKLSKSSSSKKTTDSDKKTTTTTTTQRSSTKAPSTRTTSRTTTTRTTTTTTEESYDDEYDYEEDGDSKYESEEDPKVIKELLDLIKKAGGIEELEKQLKISHNGGTKEGATTPSTKTKSLVEKFLTSRNTNKKNNNNSNNSNPVIKDRYSTINRNSRGPQNEGLKEQDGDVDEKKKNNEKPQYTSIIRRRPSQKENDSIKNEEVPEEKNVVDRNKILGEEIEYGSNSKDTTHTSPKYVDIRRQRPATTEKSSTSRYVSIERTTVPKLSDVEEESTTSVQYQTLIRRGTSTTTSTTQPSTTTSEKASPSTIAAVEISSSSSRTSPPTQTTTESEETTVSKTTPEVEITTKRYVPSEPRPFTLQPEPSRKPSRPTTSTTPHTTSIKTTDVASTNNNEQSSETEMGTTTTKTTTTTERLRTTRRKPTYILTRKPLVPSTTNAPEEVRSGISTRGRLFFRQKSTSTTTVEPTSQRYSKRKSGRRFPIHDESETGSNQNRLGTSNDNQLTKNRRKYFNINRTTTTSTTSPQKITTSTRTTTPKSVETTTAALDENAKIKQNRNKALFSKKRKMNVPVFSSTESKEESTTEHLTTLYHVFSEPIVNNTDEDNTITKNETHINTGGKIERIVEVNRIKQVNNSEGDKEQSVVDKIGAINRVTSIEVVDGNKTKDGVLEEINNRLASIQDIIDRERNNAPQGAEIIDGISHIKVITPRPIEVSTIALEGLFLTNHASTTSVVKEIDFADGKNDEDNNTNNDKSYSSNFEELLDAEHSRFVNIRIVKSEDDELGVVPAETPRVLRILPKEVAMQAKVVEVVEPKEKNQTIRIAPIQVSMARMVVDAPVVGLSRLNEKIGNTPFRSESAQSGGKQ